MKVLNTFFHEAEGVFRIVVRTDGIIGSYGRNMVELVLYTVAMERVGRFLSATKERAAKCRQRAHLAQWSMSVEVHRAAWRGRHQFAVDANHQGPRSAYGKTLALLRAAGSRGGEEVEADERVMCAVVDRYLLAQIGRGDGAAAAPDTHSSAPKRRAM